MQKLGPDGPKWGQDDFFPTNPDLADVLGDTDFDFENSSFFLGGGPRIPDSWIPRFKAVTQSSSYIWQGW